MMNDWLSYTWMNDGGKTDGGVVGIYGGGAGEHMEGMVGNI